MEQSLLDKAISSPSVPPQYQQKVVEEVLNPPNNTYQRNANSQRKGNVIPFKPQEPPQQQSQQAQPDKSPTLSLQTSSLNEQNELSAYNDLNDFEKKLQKQPFLNNFIKTTVEKGDSMMFSDLISSNHRSILEFVDNMTLDTLLHISCKTNHVDILKQIIALIISKNPNVYVVKQNILGETPLICAIDANSSECALFLLTSTIDNMLGATTHADNTTVLHHLALSKLTEAKKTLLFSMMHPTHEILNFVSSTGETALDTALNSDGNRKLVKLLLHQGAVYTKKHDMIIEKGFSYEKTMYWDEVAQYEEQKSKIVWRTMVEFSKRETGTVVFKLKAFVKDLGKSSPIDDWKKLFNVKSEMDTSKMFGPNTMTSPDQLYFLDNCLKDLELENLKNQLILAAKSRKLGGVLRGSETSCSVVDERILKKLFEMKEECIDRFEKVGGDYGEERTPIFLKLEEVVFGSFCSMKF
ncbi:hypothetical protein EIN_281590 [Entamoeba invadens IP1]|uniref:Uncharacterized protein n=1 Tax=Entamoeba invadens IP1 TaxID=370355 RepID=A0A0A1TX04_ENTIV|nr:hypothetical protein EIN_281590 [Entamoeba invadens IP1]ELP85788.1 hypothetical protein EIN_281590 [Entamoeba invadens IP1]|eukprot:XP_004185134.1 hypothetical protein EIN_281590 [Entamoeba invadens IP1]